MCEPRSDAAERLIKFYIICKVWINLLKMNKVQICDSLEAVMALEVRGPLYLRHSGAHPSPFAVLSFPKSKHLLLG